MRVPALVDPWRGRTACRNQEMNGWRHTAHDAVCHRHTRPSVRLEIRKLKGSLPKQTRRRRSSAVGRPGEHSHRGAARTCRVHEPTSHDDSRLGRAQPSTLLHPFRMEWITCSTSWEDVWRRRLAEGSIDRSSKSLPYDGCIFEIDAHGNYLPNGLARIDHTLT